MSRYRTRIRLVFVIMLISCLLCNLSVFAGPDPYAGYTYDAHGNSVPSLNGYTAKKVITNIDMGVSALSEPKDFFVQDILKKIYLLDSGNNRLLILNEDFNLLKELNTFFLNGQATTLSKPSSVFVTDGGEIYIADTDNKRVIACDEGGIITKVLGKPAVSEYPSSVDFAPNKVLVDRSGNIYVLVRGVFQGALLYSGDGTFERFFGSNKVQISLQLMTDMFWKKFMNNKQKSAMSRYVPVEFISFDTDNKGFIYTVSQEDDPTTCVRKLNFLGDNIIGESKQFGDLERVYDKRNIITQLVDVDVDSNYFVNVLDITRGRVFRYDNNFNLLFTFGITGGQMLGSFKFPAALDTLGKDILVLDSELKSITMFSPTKFGTKVEQATLLYNNGKYEDALEPWKEIITLDENYYLAYRGIGDGYYMTGHYKEAMKNYKKANDKEGFGNAFREYRNILVRKYFIFIVILFVLLIFTPAAVMGLRKRRGKQHEKE